MLTLLIISSSAFIIKEIISKKNPKIIKKLSKSKLKSTISKVSDNLEQEDHIYLPSCNALCVGLNYNKMTGGITDTQLISNKLLKKYSNIDMTVMTDDLNYSNRFYPNKSNLLYQLKEFSKNLKKKPDKFVFGVFQLAGHTNDKKN